MKDPSPSAASRPAPAANGTLAKTPFVHLLLYALDKKLAGTIELFAPDRRSAVVLFVGGEPAKVRTSEPVAYLGRVLFELGFVSEEQLDRTLGELAREKKERPRLHGEVLLEQGIITRPKLKAGLAEQVARKLRYVARLPGETAFAYYEAFDALKGWGEDAEAGFDPVPLLWAVLRESAPMEHVQAGLARVAGSPLRLVRGSDLNRLCLPAEEAAAAELLRARPMRASELAKVGHLAEQSAQLLAYLLLATKQVDVLPPTAGEVAAPAPVSQRTPSRPGEPSSSRVPASSPRPPAPSRPSPRPSHAPGPASGRPAPRTSTMPDAARRAASLPPPPPPPGIAAELADRWREIVDRAATIDRADYFMMLDVSRDASHEQVEEAFFALAKRWHPDRLPAELAPVRDACSRVFARMSEARSALANDEQRARYMKLLADGSGSPEMQETVARVVEAATHFQKAEVCFKRNDLAQAEALCRQALDLDATQPDYVAMLAWLIALKPESQGPEPTLSCIDHLTRAIKMSERCEKAFFWRGMLYKRLGKDDLAVKDFRQATELNPRNIDAAREVRLHTMRGGGRQSNPPLRRSSPLPQKPKGDAAGPKPGSLFGRLFKKP